MASPIITRPATAINYGGTLTATAPLLRSALAPASYTTDGGTLPNPSTNNLYGFRVTLGSAVDVSARKYIEFRLYLENCGQAAFKAPPYGLSVLFFDGSGNWSRFLLAIGSSGRVNYLEGQVGVEGYFVHFTSVDGDAQLNYVIEMSATPIETSGTLNWATLAGYEIHADRNSNSYTSMKIQCLRMSAIDVPTVNAGDVTTPITFPRIQALFYTSWTNTVAPHRNYRQSRPVSPMYGAGLKGSIYTTTYGFTIGDGSTDFRLDESGVSFVFRPSFTNTVVDQYPAIHVATNRQFKLNFSAGSYANIPGFTVSGAKVDGGDYDFIVTGSASGTILTNVGLIHAAGVCQLDVGEWNGYTFESCGEVVYGASATYNNCLIINNTWTSSKGLTITGAPGTYSGEFYFADNTGGKDITITPGSAGPFVLPNISIKSGQTLKLHNASATHAITVEIPAGITTSTSTAGGTITVVTPSVYQSVTLDGAAAGTLIQIYDTDTSTELYNGIPSSYPFTWTDPVAYAADRPIRLRAMFTAAATAKIFIDAPIGTATNSVPALSYLINQKDDDVYAANGKDGSTITGVTIDDTHLLISVTSSTLSWADIYAYETYWLFTAAGIRDEGRIITALDQANYLFENFSIKNTGSGVLTLTGGYGRDATTGSIVDIIDTSGNNIFPLPDHVVNNIVTVGGSNVITGDIADILAPIASIPTNPLLTNDARLDYLDAPVSDCLKTADYDTPDNASIAALPTLTEIEASTILAKEATVSSRLAAAAYTAPDNDGIATIKAKTDTIPASPAQTGEYTAALAALPTLSEIEASTLAKEATVAALNDISVADIMAAASTTPISANVKEVNDTTVKGSGTELDPWGPI